MSPPSYKGDAALQKILTEINFYQDIYSVKSFVAGYVWGLEMLPPSALIDALLRKDTDGGEIVLKDEDQAMKFYGSVMGLWNEFASQNQKIICAIRPLPNHTDDNDSLFYFLSNLTTDMGNFLGALMDTGSLHCNDPAINNLENEIVELCDLLEEILLDAADTRLSTAKKEEFYEALLLCQQKWKIVFPAMGKALDKYRKQSMAVSTNPPLSTVPKSGRNEPCTCGSGKKYKKCCMLKIVQ